MEATSSPADGDDGESEATQASVLHQIIALTQNRDNKVFPSLCSSGHLVFSLCFASPSDACKLGATQASVPHQTIAVNQSKNNKVVPAHFSPVHLYLILCSAFHSNSCV